MTVNSYLPQLIYLGLVLSRLITAVNRKFKTKHELWGKTIGAFLSEIFFVLLLYWGGFFK